MMHPFWKSLLTNPLAKTIATVGSAGLAFAADATLQQVFSGSVNVFQGSGLTLLAFAFAHNFLSFERDRVFGETATPAQIPKDPVPVLDSKYSAPAQERL